ncbi:MAG TPA: arsenate reductase family protein [Candidatus Faecousia faecavium]|nr:arsenate reductase family protein [Candidatus Faecousia faecavium]
MLFLEYPPCSTCKKAKKWLDDHGLTYTARHIKEENPTYEELSRWLEVSGLPVKKFFNTSGLQYKALGLKEKLPQMSQDEQLRLLSSDGMLVKRPIVVTEDGSVLVGFREEQWTQVLL